MQGLFGEIPDAEGKAKPKPAEPLFCKKWTLEQATEKMLDLSFQNDKKFPKLKAELYAYSFSLSNRGNNALFNFLETRFNQNIIQDKEVHLHFETVHSREEAMA